MRLPRIVVVGASSGGIEALTSLVATIPADLAAPVCVVVHVAPTSPGMLPGILTRAGNAPAVFATDGLRMQDGRIYIAPADHHMIVEPGMLILTRGPKENNFRPAIDPLFRSAAQVYGPAAIGVLLSGALDDGTAGLQDIKRLGGVALVQDPGEALFPSMPESAIAHGVVDHVASAADLGRVVAELVRTPQHELHPVPVPESLEVEVKIAKEHNPLEAGVLRLGDPSTLTCPDCHGVLFRIVDGTLVRFRCHTGHAFSADSLTMALDTSVESAMWNAVRALDECEFLMKELAKAMSPVCNPKAADIFNRSETARRDSEAVRRLVMARQGLAETTDVQDPV